MEKKYPHLFQPGRIGELGTKNRIKYAATETNFPFGDGYVSDKEVAYMEAQARGGAGRAAALAVGAEAACAFATAGRFAVGLRAARGREPHRSAHQYRQTRAVVSQRLRRADALQFPGARGGAQAAGG